MWLKLFVAMFQSNPVLTVGGVLSASAPVPVCTVMWKGSGRAWQERRYLDSVRALAVPSSHKIASVKPPPPPGPAGCQFVRQPDADPFRPAGCHLAEELKSLEDPFPRFEDIRAGYMLRSEDARRKDTGKERGGGLLPSLQPTPPRSLFDRESCGCHPEDGCRSRQLTLTRS